MREICSTLKHTHSLVTQTEFVIFSFISRFFVALHFYYFFVTHTQFSYFHRSLFFCKNKERRKKCIYTQKWVSIQGDKFILSTSPEKGSLSWVLFILSSTLWPRQAHDTCLLSIYHKRFHFYSFTGWMDQKNGTLCECFLVSVLYTLLEFIPHHHHHHRGVGL